MKHDDFLKALKSLKDQNTKKPSQKVHYTTSERDEQTPHCIYKDSNGHGKYLYTSQTEIEYILSSNTIKLRSYPCPYEKGWHITKV